MSLATRRGLAAMLAAAVAASALGTAPSFAQVVVRERVMPAPLVETIPLAPGPAYRWVPGHWDWRGRWVWIRGHYVVGAVPAMPAAVVETIPVSPGPGWRWAPGHYVWERGGWVWRRGVWVR
jgi:hypothetical protein